VEDPTLQGSKGELLIHRNLGMKGPKMGMPSKGRVWGCQRSWGHQRLPKARGGISHGKINSWDDLARTSPNPFMKMNPSLGA